MACSDGYDPWVTTDAVDALDQAASYLDCALGRAKKWPEITLALSLALADIRDEYKKQTGKDW